MRRAHLQGFTTVELVVTLVIAGVIFAVAAVRLSASSGLAAEGLRDEAVAALRYAQKMAIAERRSVCAVFTNSSLSLWVHADCDQSCDAQLCALPPDCTTPDSNARLRRLILPTSDASKDVDGDGTPDGNVVARSGARFQTLPTVNPLVFDCRGRWDHGGSSSTQSIQVQDVANVITVEHETGYVH